MSGLAELSAVLVDCADPTALAGFYRSVTGWEVTYDDGDYVYLGSGPIQLAFQRIPDYRPPNWPDAGKHFHLDFKVDDVEGKTAELVALGATKPAFQPGEGKYVVLTDPEGHVFCIMN